MKMTFQEIRIIATGPCIANQLRDVNTICRRSWYIAAHVWKIYDFKIEVVSLIINFSTEVATLATDYAVELGLKGKDGKPLSLQWFRNFMDRWPELKTQRPRALGLSRAKCTSQEVVDSYFDELETILTKYNLKDKPHCIYNIDEKGLSPEHTPPKVVGDSDAQPPSVISERDKTTTINYNRCRQCCGNTNTTISSICWSAYETAIAPGMYTRN